MKANPLLPDYGLPDNVRDEIVRAGLRFLELCESVNLDSNTYIVGIQLPPTPAKLEEMRLLGFNEGVTDTVRKMRQFLEQR